jgi:hypothetical protein
MVIIIMYQVCYYICIFTTYLNETCRCRADRGECENAKTYMVGDATSNGQCRRTCGVCVPCAPHDNACVSKTRAEQGFLPDLQGELLQLFPEASNSL